MTPEPKHGWIILGIGYSPWVENRGKIYQDEETAMACAGLLPIETKVIKILLQDCK